jgi:hypothetical protein
LLLALFTGVGPQGEGGRERPGGRSSACGGAGVSARYSVGAPLLLDRRARRHAHAQGDRAAPLRPPHTQALRRRVEGGAAYAPLLGRRRPISTTGSEWRVETPSQGGAILGSLCPPNRQMRMACLSSSYTARERNVLLLTSAPSD